MQKYFVFLIILLLIFTTLILRGQSFTEYIDNGEFVGMSGSTIAVGDIDNDEDLDMLIVGFPDGINTSSKLYINNGDGSFSENGEHDFLTVYLGDVKFSDIDNDSDLDVIITGKTGLGFADPVLTKIYFNDSQGNFTESISNNIRGINSGGFDLADINNDSYVDIVISGTTGFSSSFAPITEVYINDGTGNFLQIEDSLLPLRTATVQFSDIDNDGDSDLLLAGVLASAVTRLYLNNDSGVFLESENNIIGVGGDAKFFDVDNDNDNDLIISGSIGDGFVDTTVLYLNNGFGNFTISEDNHFVPLSGSIIDVADIDNDDDIDILLAGNYGDVFSSSKVTKLYLNNGFGEFIEYEGTLFDSISSGDIVFADIDNDNDKDVFLSGNSQVSDEKILKLYLNEVITRNSNINSSEEELTIFPNPTQGDMVNIVFYSPGVSEVVVTIFNGHGEYLKNDFLSLSSGENILNLTGLNLPSGLYIIMLKGGDFMRYGKLIISN